jgi:nitrite reductase (NADH) small subunit
MYKQSFDLRTGRCLDDETVELTTYPVKVSNGMVVVDIDGPDGPDGFEP